MRLMAEVSNQNTTPVIRMIPFENILPNPDNFYTVRDLDALMDSIALIGIQQPLVVTPCSGKPGKFSIISGERRWTSISKLVRDKEHPREDLRLVPCIVQLNTSPAMEELQLIMANSTTRDLTNAEISRQAARVEILLYQLKEEGQEFPGRMRDQVAKACKVSAPKLARLKVIREKLKATELVYLFEKDKLSEQAAYALARLPEDLQQRIAKAMGQDTPSGSAAERILEKYNGGCSWEPDLQCPDGKACRRGDTFLRHDLEHPYDMCGGEKCCLTCSRAKDSYSPCDRMCSKAQVARKEKRDEAKAQADARAREAAKGYQATTKERAQRLLRAIDAAGLPDESKFAWRYYWKPIRVSDLRRWAAGEFNEEEDLWTCAELDPERIESPVALAQLFGCTTDYLLGLSDELTAGAAPENQTPEGEAPGEPAAPPPAEETGADPAKEDSPDDVAAPDRAVPESPQLGKPPAEGWIPLAWLDGRQRPVKDKQLAAVKYNADGIYMLDVARWFMDTREWRYPGGIEIGDVEILGWFPLPED